MMENEVSQDVKLAALNVYLGRDEAVRPGDVPQKKPSMEPFAFKTKTQECNSRTAPEGRSGKRRLPCA